MAICKAIRWKLGDLVIHGVKDIPGKCGEHRMAGSSFSDGEIKETAAKSLMGLTLS
ncbi:predicted protein [Sclerotinia sclerotiorum 1980 UF-70]|uniref:Uncharacterized protein n=1 Tax=Sclerotinia sclerotiorum (strain ATCC 18683 / 1980 / Ss-1) TaxID=665079 RepID=A7EI83_SCLS1|nr:predicted protein [Sclerotinia sclerotiorum 1980 UF-70]EDO02549.1 predicted protein [Sclerotinia sclerotiorum 1980 UF-70]